MILNLLVPAKCDRTLIANARARNIPEISQLNMYSVHPIIVPECLGTFPERSRTVSRYFKSIP